MKRYYFDSLDGIRGIAAILVAVRHLGRFFDPIDFQQSYLAVDIFFVLSGVVIANAYENRLLSKLSVAKFMKIRAARLYPLYLLGGLIGVVTILLTPESDIAWPHLVLLAALHAFFIPYLTNPGEGGSFPLDLPAWSLFFEVLINFVYAIWLPALKTGRLVMIMAASALCLMVVLYISHRHQMDCGWSTKTMPVGLVRVSYSFFAGVFLYRIFTARRPTQMAGRHAVWAIGGVSVVVAGLLMASPSDTFLPYFDFVAIVILFPTIVYFALWIKLSNSVARFCRFLGTISYALYVLHYPVAKLTRISLERFANITVDDYAPYIGFMVLTLLILACWLIDNVYDIPFRRAILKLKLQTGGASLAGNAAAHSSGSNAEQGAPD
jgi:peptidoglycan/LPS O-acetylase OafA/YrhL